MFVRKRISGIVGLCVVGALPIALVAQETNRAEPSRFMRFVQTSESEGHVDTASTTYSRADGVRVDLVAAVHIADRRYYQTLDRQFTNYDVVLYEMVKPSDVHVTSSERSASPVSALQIGMKKLLGLEFQLDAINYSATNFVHADMDPEMFFKAQEQNGESLFGLMIRAMLSEQMRQATATNQADGFQMLLALFSQDSDFKLKFLLGRQLETIEGVLADVDQGPAGKGSVLVSGRNQVALRVLSEQIQQGKRKAAIFYGAGHMGDLEKRLQEIGFKKVSEEWLTAWDIRKPTR